MLQRMQFLRGSGIWMLPRFFSSNGIVFELLLKEYKFITYKTGCMLQRNSCLEWEMYAFCLIHQDFSFISNGYLPQKSRFSSAFVCKSELKTEVLISQLELLCVPDAELDSMKVSFCQIRATDQKAYFMIKLLILCMHACMYIRYKFFLGQHE